jgi:hypothetical protein
MVRPKEPAIKKVPLKGPSLRKREKKREKKGKSTTPNSTSNDEDIGQVSDGELADWLATWQLAVNQVCGNVPIANQSKTNGIAFLGRSVVREVGSDKLS